MPKKERGARNGLPLSVSAVKLTCMRERRSLVKVLPVSSLEIQETSGTTKPRRSKSK